MLAKFHPHPSIPNHKFNPSYSWKSSLAYWYNSIVIWKLPSLLFEIYEPLRLSKTKRLKSLNCFVENDVVNCISSIFSNRFYTTHW